MVVSDKSANISKKSHKKSKYGCTNCKKRRVKCDEGFPICKNCKRRNEDCSYTNIRPPDPSEGSNDEMVAPDSFHPRCIGRPFELDEELIKSLNRAQARMDSISISDIDPSLPSLTSSSSVLSTDSSSLTEYPRIELVSNNGNTMFPSYLSHTVMNNRAMLYFTSTFYRRISPIAAYSKPWGEIPHFSYQYINICHLLYSVMFLSMYHDTFDPNSSTPNFLDLKDPNDYLVIAKLNYDLFLQEMSIMKRRPKVDAKELVAELVSSMLELLNFAFSPSLTICDPLFIKKCMQLGVLTTEVLPLLKSSCSKTEGVPLNYYSPSSVPDLQFDANIFFPDYLYFLCSYIPLPQHADVPHTKCSSAIIEMNKSFLSSSSTSTTPEEINNSYEKFLDSSFLSDEQALRIAIDLLKREFMLAYQDDGQDVDAFRTFIRWPMLLPAGFGRLISRQDNRALVLMAHFIMLIASIRTNKIMAPKVFVDELTNIDSIMSDEFKPWLDLPKRVLGLQ